MTAVRQIYPRNRENAPPNQRYSVNVLYGGRPLKGVRPDRIIAVTEQSMSWLNASHIHTWFVENVQNGQDDCGQYYVPTEKLEELLEVCDSVIENSELVSGMVEHSTGPNHYPAAFARREPGRVLRDSSVAERLLPVREGYYNGYLEYDEAYLEAVVATRAWLRQLQADQGSGVPGDIYYSSKW